jgi:hypothetical protein
MTENLDESNITGTREISARPAPSNTSQPVESCVRACVVMMSGRTGLGGDETKELGHGGLAVQHGLVEVDVEDLRTVLDLQLGDLQRFLRAIKDI